jgi:hypothetical protein
MPKNKLIVACLVVCLFPLLVACSAPAGAATTPQAAASPAANQGAAEDQEDQFEVIAWVDNPTPALGERVNLSGSLIKNGVYLGGMMMQATWPDQDQERGVPNCNVLVIYQRGVCIIETEGFTAGEYVPVTVKFVYKDQTYTGQTGFTLK